MEITYRKGKKEDLPHVLGLIRELAIYEKAPDEVSNTLERMEEEGFGKKVFYEFFVAEVKGRITGIAVYYWKYSTWKGKCLFLEDLIVTEKERGKGIGKRLFELVMEESYRAGVERMEWQVLDWNTPAIDFYKAFGASLDPEWLNGKLVLPQLKEYFEKEKSSASQF